MEGDKPRTLVRRPDVLKKLNTENLLMIERGLLGDLPDKLKPRQTPVRGRLDTLEVAKPTSFFSSCLPAAPDSPGSEKLTSSDDESSPVKKTFSFRNKFSRLSFLSKSRDKSKWKAIEEHGQAGQVVPVIIEPTEEKYGSKTDQEHKTSKRFWLFRNKEVEFRGTDHSPIYKRSKSFEFLPRALEEEENESIELLNKKQVRNSRSFVYGSTDSMGDAWVSNDSLHFGSPGIKPAFDDPVFIALQSIKESGSASSSQCPSLSTVGSSNSSGGIVNILKSDSVQDLFDDFERAVDLFGESYLSDSETYTKSEDKLKIAEKRKSSSFSTLPSPKIVQLNPTKVDVLSEDFKRELSVVLSAKRGSQCGKTRSSRRGSVTDWFVLEENRADKDDRYRRAQRKPANRVRRMSSTKYKTLLKQLPEQKITQKLKKLYIIMLPKSQTDSENTKKWSNETRADNEMLQ